MLDGAVSEAIRALWVRHLGPARDFTLTASPVSGNNRVFKVQADGRTAIAKWYTDSGTRDRLDAEWRFLTYAQQAGITCVPAPLARDDANRLALHGYREGSRPANVGAAEVDAVIAFFRALNGPAREHADLPDAAEAAFSPAEHFAILDRRIGLLSGIDAPAQDLAARMAEAWGSLRERLTHQLDPAPLKQRCVSPSDFGFHNALVGPAGISFIDFEYGGWDDPAKALCDFTLQPGVPVPPALGRRFMEDIADAALLERARLMRPMFALKWCCIMLNPLVPALARPGQFSDPTADPAERKVRQLAKAQAAFDLLFKESD